MVRFPRLERLGHRLLRFSLYIRRGRRLGPEIEETMRKDLFCRENLDKIGVLDGVKNCYFISVHYETCQMLHLFFWMLM